MSETEKVTVNLSVVDLGKVDLLVAQGFHSNRTDFIRDAIRRALQEHEPALQSTISQRAYSVGIVQLSRHALEANLAKGIQLDMRVLGMLVVADDVTPSLASRGIAKLEVRGVLRAAPAVREVLAQKMA
jgi:Arc/MetJ-type ribon-helix-helix transcriptional regulator